MLEHGLDIIEEASVCTGSFPLSVSRRRDHIFTGRVNIYSNDRENEQGQYFRWDFSTPT